MTRSNMLDSLIFTGFLGRVSSPVSITFQKARELLCDAVACLLTIEEHWSFKYLQPMVFFDKNLTSPYSLPAETFDWSPHDFVFLAACFLGDIDAVQHSLKMTDHVPRNIEDTQRLRFAGLYIAVRRDRRRLISFFLITSVKVSNQNWLYVLCAAVQTGNISMLQHFLDPEYSKQEGMPPLGYILSRAAEHTDTIMRIEMCKLLLPFCGQVDIDFRTSILRIACRSNDVDFAKWIIGTGPVMFYDKEITNRPHYEQPLYLAVDHGSIEIIRFLLKSKFNVHKDFDQYAIQQAYCRARQLGRFDIFMHLLPYQTQFSREEILAHAAGIDHALEAVDKLLGLAKITPAKISTPEKAFNCSGIMEEAVHNQLISNIEWLLKHGFRTKTVVKYELGCQDYGPHSFRHQFKTKSNRTIFQDLERIDHLFRAYNNPGIEVRCRFPCTSPMDLKDIMHLPRPWEYKCACDKTP